MGVCARCTRHSVIARSDGHAIVSPMHPIRNALIRCLVLALPLLALAGRADAIELMLPIDCELGKACFIQNYVDVDPGLGVKDYACGAATYDGHDGTDFRVLSLEAAEPGITVRAAAGGVVLGFRDAIADRLLMTEADKEAVKGKECGNGVTLDHGGGWQTQYCHMRRGSIRVKTGETLAAGAALGLIGGSGLVEFPHMHFSVRFNGLPVDPFIGTVVKGECAPDATGALSGTLWAKSALSNLSAPRTTVLETGFAGGEVNSRQLEIGRSRVAKVGPESPALLFYARVMHVRKGDVLRLVVYGPDGELVRTPVKPLDRDKAIYVGYAGKKRKEGRPWQGTYEGIAEIVRDGEVVATGRARIQPGS